MSGRPVVVIRLRRRLRHGARPRTRDRFPHPRGRRRHVDALEPLGVDHIDMPATPARVWETITRARTGAAAQ